MQQQQEGEQWRFGYRTTADEVVAGLDLSDKTFLITGANSGIGKETALSLARAKARVLIAVRNVQAGEEAAREIKEQTGNDNVHVLQLDLGSLQSVRQCVEAYKALGLSKLDGIICNAGIMALVSRTTTVDGFEAQFGTNHLGHFLLVNLLLPELLKASKPRVVSLSSLGHRLAGVDFDNINWEKEGTYDKWKAYGASKTANILFTIELQRRYGDRGLTANAVHPGGIMTNLQKEMSREEMMAFGWIDAEGKINERFKTPQQGASTSVWATVAPELEGRGGNYLEDCKISQTVTPESRDPALAEKL